MTYLDPVACQRAGGQLDASGHVDREWKDKHAMVRSDGFAESLRAFRLQKSGDERDPRNTTHAVEPPIHDRRCQTVSVDFVTTHLAREIEEGARSGAVALGIEFESLTVATEVVSEPSAQVLGFGNRPWIRYAIKLSTVSDPSSIEQLHGKLVATTVQRLAHEYETPIVGNIVIGRPTVLRNQEAQPGNTFERSAHPGIVLSVAWRLTTMLLK